MRKQRLSLLLIMLFLAIGFAAVTTNLIINGTSKIGVGDVDVFFDNVHIEYTMGSMDGDVTVSNDKKTITFNTDKLDSKETTFVLGYDVRNASKEYDANVTFNMNFVTGEELKDKIIMVVYNVDDLLNASREAPSVINNNDTFLIPAGEKMSFIFGVGLMEPVLEDHTIEITITYDVEPIERTSAIEYLGNEEVESYFALEPGLYTLDKQQTKTWQELIDEGIIHINEGVLSTNLVSSDGSIDEKTGDSRLTPRRSGYISYDNIETISERNTSCETLQGMLVVDENVDNVEENNLICSGLKVLVLKNPMEDNLYNIRNYLPVKVLFSKNTELNSLVVSSLYHLSSYFSALNPVIIGDYAVDPYNNDILLSYLGDENELTLPDNFYAISGHPFLYSNVENLTIPDSVTDIKPEALEDVGNVFYHGPATYGEDDQFWGAKYLNPTFIGDFVLGGANSDILIGYNGDSTNIVIPEGVREIVADCFEDIELESVTLPSTLEKIGEYAFWYTGLTQLEVPSSVTEIGESAFKGIQFLTYHGTATYEEDNQYWGAKYLNATIIDDFVLTGDNNEILVEYLGTSKDIVIPNGVTTIGDNVFKKKTLNSVTFNNSVTTIGEYAFAYTGLTQLEVPSSVTEIGESAFEGIQRLTYHGTATYEEDDLYWGAKYLNATIIDDFVLTGDNNEKLIDYLGTSKDIVIPDGVITIGDNVFKNKTLNSVTFNNSVTTIGEYAFAYTGLGVIDVPNTVIEIGQSAFKNITIVNYTGSATYASSDKYWGASYMNASINGDYILSEDQKTILKYIGSSHSVIIPDGITAIGDNAFSSKYLSSVTIPSSVTTIGEYAFANGGSSLIITVPDTVTSIGYHAFYKERNINYNGSATYAEDDLYWGARMINGGYTVNGLVFTDSTQRVLVDTTGTTAGKNIVIPDTVVEIGMNTFEYKDATSIVIPDSVKTIREEAFHWCRLDSVLVVPSTVETIKENAFDGARVVEYHGTLTDSKNWGATAFNAYIEDYHAYSDSTKTTLLSYFGTEKNYTISDTVTTIGPSAFFYNVFDEFNLTDNITSIGRYAFMSSTINKLTIPRSITTINSSMLLFCDANEIILPDTLLRIDNGAFNYTEITSITIPASVNYLGTELFSTSSHVNSVTFENTTGWTVTKGSETINVDSGQLTDPTSAFNLLNTTYKDYTWSRS